MADDEKLEVCLQLVPAAACAAAMLHTVVIAVSVFTFLLSRIPGRMALRPNDTERAVVADGNCGNEIGDLSM